MVAQSKNKKNEKLPKLHRIEPSIINPKAFRFYEMVRNYEYKKIMIPTQEGSRLVPLTDVLFIQGEGNYISLHLTNGEKILLSNTIKHWEEKLNSPFFSRCHKSYLINKNLITKISYAKNEVYLDAVALPISRYRKASFLKELNMLI